MGTEIESLVKQYDQGLINRRQLLAALAGIAGTSCSSGQESDGPAFDARSLNHVTLSVKNVQQSQAFYSKILGVREISRQKGGVNLGLGDSFLGLYQINEPPRVNHFCVGLDEFHVQVAAERLRQYGITPRVRQDKPEVYFSDPDGINVQLESKNYRG